MPIAAIAASSSSSPSAEKDEAAEHICCRGFGRFRMSPPRRSVLERRGGDRPSYFFLAFFLPAFFFFFGPFFAAPFEAAALARFRLAFMCINPLCRRNAFDSMKLATESRMEMQLSGVELLFLSRKGVKTESRARFAVFSPRISRRIGRSHTCARCPRIAARVRCTRHRAMRASPKRTCWARSSIASSTRGDASSCVANRAGELRERPLSAIKPPFRGARR